MENIAADNIIKHLASYDFEKPIEVTIILDDGDEDDNQRKINNSTAKDTSETISRESIHKEIDFLVTQKLIEKSVQKCYGNTINKVINNKNQYRPMPKSKKQNRSIDQTEVLAKKKKIDNEQDKHTPNTAKRKETCKDNRNCMPATVIPGPCPNKPETNNSNETPIVISNFFTNRTQGNTATTKLCTYLDNLLKSLSEHMVHIIDAYNYFMCVRKNRNIYNIQHINNAWSQFLRLKEQYFNLSYCTLVTVMLDHDRNSIFIEKFLENTVEVAVARKLVCSHQQLRSLYAEMIHWAAEKSKRLQSSTYTPCENMSITRNYNILKQRLNQPPLNLPQPLPANNHSLNKSGGTCIFSAGPANQEIRITVEPSLINTQNSSTYTNSSNSSNSNSTHNLPINRTQNTVYLEPRSSVINKAAPVLSNVSGQQRTANAVTWNSASCNQTSNVPKVQKPPTYFSGNNTAIPKNCTDNQSAQQTQNEQSQSNTIETHIALKSTDSGFMSPPVFDNSEQTIATNIEDDGPSPVITHITSLCSIVAKLSEGVCFVCKKATDMKCLGCLECFYCSLDCQKMDWNTHQAKCKKKEYVHN